MSEPLIALPEELDELRTPAYGPYSFVRDLLTPHSRVLDVGCGNGKVAKYLGESGATVDGIEPAASRSGAAAKRVRHLSTTPAGDEDPELLAEYDVVTFFDVVEHLAEPAPVLEWAMSKLAPEGLLIASIPNSAHWSFRKKVLHGNWEMDDWGLFDRTHLHFYDPNTAAHLRPVGAVEIDRRFFTPATGLQTVGLRHWPALFALHVVMVWKQA